MSKSLIETWAAQPPNMRKAIELAVRLVGVSAERRREVCESLPAGVRERLLAWLPEPGLPPAEAEAARMQIVVEGCGDAGREWLTNVRGHLWMPDEITEEGR